MILTILALGGTILAGTTVAGLLVAYQIRQTTDLANSAKAIFAADTGIEWGLYQFFKSGTPPALSNKATFTTICYDEASGQIDCANASVVRIRSVGRAAAVSRALEQSF